MLIVHVHIQVKPACVDDFVRATAENARSSLQEEGIARFDLIQSQDDPTTFILMEAYRTPEAPALHKETAHFRTWFEAVDSMMAGPRRAVRYHSRVPGDAGWG
ncbi:MAG: putative quinol monooxygenase [Myxococcota bacterium]